MNYIRQGWKQDDKDGMANTEQRVTRLEATKTKQDKHRNKWNHMGKK
jgi:hypothetical protein